MNHSHAMDSSSISSEFDQVEVPKEPINFRDDIELDDKALVVIDTKSLNRLMKKKGISKRRQREIKEERRKLKNRGKSELEMAVIGFSKFFHLWEEHVT